MSDTARHVTVAGDFAGEYVVDEELDDGRLLIRPERPYPSVFSALGGRPATGEEFKAFVGEHDVQPPDGEG